MTKYAHAAARTPRPLTFKSWALAGVAAAALASAGAAAQADAANTAPVEFDIAAQDLGAALNAYAMQSGREILFLEADVAGKRAGPLEGEMTPDVALRTLLADAGVDYRVNELGAVLIGAAAQAPARVQPISSQGRRTQAQPVREERQDAEPVETAAAEDEEERAHDVIVVTGTRIRGLRERFSPTTTVSRAELELSGQDSAAAYFETLPQNFGGGPSLDNSIANSVSGPGAASVNLRGLGNEATLILLNGRRLPVSGGQGAFVDISGIPSSVIERIDVVADGASAIYGSDAIGGVVNIILRDDFEGAETRLGFDTLTQGGGESLQIGQTVGFDAGDANGLLTYEYAVSNVLDSEDRDYAEFLPDPFELLPFRQKHAVLAAGGADLSERVSVTADAFFNQQKNKQQSASNVFSDSTSTTTADVEQFGGSAGLAYEFTDEWRLDISGGFARENKGAFDIFVRNGDPSVSPTGLNSAIESGDLSVGGPLFRLSAEPTRVVFGLHARSETFKVNRDFLEADLQPQPGVTPTREDRSREVWAAYGEAYIPLITPEAPVLGVESLSLIAAGRYDDYSDVGSSFNPKLGVTLSVSEALGFRGTYGTSFRAPRLEQLQNQTTAVLLAGYADPTLGGAQSTALLIAGNTDQLDPEEATSWTVGADYTPAAVSGLELSATYFSVDYEGRIALPSLRLDPQTFLYTDFAGIVERNPTPEQVQTFVDTAPFFSDLCARFGAFLNNCTVDDVSVLLRWNPINLSTTEVDGLDFEARYSTDLAGGDAAFFLNGTYLFTFENIPQPGADVEDILNTFENPVDLRLRGGAQWSQGGVTLAAFINHVGDYIDDDAIDPEFEVDAWTTVDASLRWDLEEATDWAFGEGLSVVLTATNVFDQDPPEIGESIMRTDAFDAANAAPGGRQVSLLLTKRW